MTKPAKLLLIVLVGAALMSCGLSSLNSASAADGDVFAISVTKHRDDASRANWSVKLAAGAINLTLNWKP
jgi:hypothetical protein